MDRPIEADVQALAEEVKQLRAQLEKVMSLVGQTARHGGDEALKQAREAGQRAWNDARHTADDVIHRIEAKPVQSALAAFGTGLVLGLIFGGRR